MSGVDGLGNPAETQVAANDMASATSEAPAAEINPFEVIEDSTVDATVAYPSRQSFLVCFL